MAKNTEKMEKIVALCKRRGFIFQSSEIYGGINGFWDYGPLGVELKRNIKEAWWNDMVQHPPVGPDGKEISMVGVDCSIIMNPRVWEASGHVGGFADPMVDCKETKARYRADQISVVRERTNAGTNQMYAFVGGDEESADKAHKRLAKYLKTSHPLPSERIETKMLLEVPVAEFLRIVAPEAKEPGTLTEPRSFNLMFKTFVGALEDPSAIAWLRPETAQGIFANFRNVIDSTRVKIPFGIAQVGKAFRNEINPRNYTFRSREFEQMEIEFFCHDKDSMMWWQWWRDTRINWYKSLGLAGENLKPRNQDEKELAHYSKACTDIEYYFPFADDPQELEGVAHRGCFDLTQHAQHSGKDMSYFDDETKERFTPTVIEPSAGADRSTLAFICEAYHEDPNRASPELMKFHPRLAPIKAAVFPLVNKDGMPEIAEAIFRDIRKRWPAQYDAKQSIGRRYARMDEAGTPYCFTIDGQTKEDGTVTVRDRDTAAQERIDKSRVVEYLAERI
jgi:glycyl-tRNA synthetase